MRKFLSFALFVVVLLPPSLVAQEPTPASRADTATVYVYRLRKAYAALLKPSVYMDSNQQLRMENGRFATVLVTPGDHTFTSNFPGNGLIITAKPGESYYIRMEMTPASLVHTSKGQISQVEPGQGKFEVSQLKPSDPADTKPDGTVQKEK